MFVVAHRVDSVVLVPYDHPLKEQRQNNFLGRENSTDKNDVVSKESVPKNIKGRRQAESSTTVHEWGGGNAPNQLLGGQPESSVKQKDWSSNVGSPGTKAPNQLDDHPLKEQSQNNFLGRENSTDKNGNKYAVSNSLDSAVAMNIIPEGC
ncbi:hypothetical protein F2P56_001454 [Juglans regia]|uniref:Uncharacterized protein n=1 Tax=Juglans regia TaxID=51240 RepID=A0A833YA82_JUGRE|nr:hypothetical protein F2P56_001454 [Juglans regia]